MQSNWNWLLNAIWFNLIKFNSIWFCWWSDWCWWWCRWGLRCRGSKWPPSNSFKPQPRSWTKSVKHVWTYSIQRGKSSAKYTQAQSWTGKKEQLTIFMHTVLKIYLSRGSRADSCPLGPDFCGRWAHSPLVQLFCDTLGFSSDTFSPSNWLPGSQQHSQRLLQPSSEGRKLGLGWWKFPQSYHPVPYTTISWVSEPICIRQDFNKRHQSFLWAWNQVVNLQLCLKALTTSIFIDCITYLSTEAQ